VPAPALALGLGVVLTALGGCARVPDPTRMHFPPVGVTEPELIELTLPNGLRLHLLPDRGLPLIQITALVRTGSIYEPADKVGLASLTGGLMREGGAGDRDPNALDDALADAAITMESGIGGEAGSAHLDTLTRNFPLALSAFADMLRRPRFDPDRLETLRQNAIEALRRRDDRPANIANRIYRQTIYGPDHPLAREPTEAGLRALTRDDVVAFHARYYTPGNTVLGITGDFDPDWMVARITAAFGDWPDRPVTFPDVPPVPETTGRVVRFVHRPIDHVSIRIGETSLRRDDPDHYAFSLVDGILGGQVTMNRLFAAVRTQGGMAYSVGSDYAPGHGRPGVFTMTAGTRPDMAGPVIRKMLAEAERMRDEPVPEPELDAAREAFLNAFVFSSVTARQLVGRRMQLDYFGLPRDEVFRVRAKVLAATPKDLFDAARAHLHPDRMVIVAVGDRAVLKDALAPYGEVEEVPLETPEDTPEGPGAGAPAGVPGAVP
jgi:zinc protease